MIPSLYPIFFHWASTGSVYIISDTHFNDPDCFLMDKDWLSPLQHMEKIKAKVKKNDTLIHLGDVGEPAYLDDLKCYKVLITGNHDVPAKMALHFCEVYTGPVFISNRILLSHEPVFGLESYCLNIHGHIHDKNAVPYKNHINLASNIYNFELFNLGKEIKNGILKDISSYHRVTIDKASKK